MALARPVGIAINAAPMVIIIVPQTRGRTPKDDGSNRGVQVVPRKNSEGDTVSKNLRVSDSSRMTMAAVVTMDTKAQAPNHAWIRNSPQRTPDLFMEAAFPVPGESTPGLCVFICSVMENLLPLPSRKGMHCRPINH